MEILFWVRWVLIHPFVIMEAVNTGWTHQQNIITSVADVSGLSSEYGQM